MVRNRKKIYGDTLRCNHRLKEMQKANISPVVLFQGRRSRKTVPLCMIDTYYILSTLILISTFLPYMYVDLAATKNTTRKASCFNTSWRWTRVRKRKNLENRKIDGNDKGKLILKKDKGKYDVWMEHKSNLYVLSVYLIEFHSYILKRIPMEYVSIL